MRKFATPLLAACVLAASGRAGANDSSATLAAGGLVLTRSNAIEMRAEDLYLSTHLVRVRYRFANVTAAPVTVEVAFPMPDLTPDPDDIEGPPINTEAPTNFLG